MKLKSLSKRVSKFHKRAMELARSLDGENGEGVYNNYDKAELLLLKFYAERCHSQEKKIEDLVDRVCKLEDIVEGLQGNL